MHDVLTHTVSAVAVQAGALRLRLPAGTESEAVEALESASREALLELRQLLGVLRDDVRQLDPAPGLDDLEQLTAPLAATGIDVTVERKGPTTEVPAGTALAVYRLVQESLTNIGKHGSARHVAIDIARIGSCLSVTVTNDGPATRSWLPGHGITGMRERVMAHGGELEVGPLPEGDGWRVHGKLPL
jgi:signal transduction histidine kinase